MKIKTIITILSVFSTAVFLPIWVFASQTEGTIDSTYKYAWSENAGWINFGCGQCNVLITDSGLTGYAWNDNYGWINLSPTNSGVTNNGEGNLVGYAWAENLGWIDFDNVSINASGKFTGAASGDISGVITFDCANCDVRTDWRPQSARTPTPTCGDGTCNGSETCSSCSADCGSCGGGGLPPETYNPPTAPEGGFKILINDDATETNSLKVILTLKGGPNTKTVWISENSQFPEDYQVSYNALLTQVSISRTLSEGKGEKTIYAKFCTQWGRCSEVVSDSIFYKKEVSIEKILEILKPLVSEFLKPKLPEVKPPEVPTEELVPKEAPLAFQGKWQLLPSKPIKEFVLAPLPKEIRKLAEKFPELGETLKKVGITKITDIEKLKTVKLTLPGLTERIGLPTAKIEPGKFALPQGVPVAELPPHIKQQLPTEIVFAKTGSELIDFNIALSVSDKGEPQQKIETISGKPLQLVVKPDKPVKSIKGYVVFKSRKSVTYNLKPETNKFQVSSFRFQDLTASLFFAVPSFAKPQEQPVRVEEKLVLLEFEYTDPDGDGIYTAEIQAPLIEGEYEIITVMDFDDPELGKKEIRLTTVVDPEGYIYEKDGDKETRIPGAIVSLWWLNPETKQYELWPAKEYQQENPQTTDVRGTYSFLVPEGYYYLKAESPGYLVYDGKPFQVKEGSGIHINIELKTRYWWLKVVDWKTILLVAVIILLLYNFYRDKIRERLFRR
ncbi:MAG: hypothetical protein AB1643_01635 [Patescibacteria group bacterium]